MKKILAFVLAVPGFLQAECITDLYTVGVSLDSYTYEINSDHGESVDIGSDGGGGFKLGKIIYCPDSKREYYPYYRLRYFSLKEARKEKAFQDLDEEIILNSAGMDTRFILDSKKESLLDVEIREEYKPANMRRVDFEGFSLDDDRYFNLKALGGMRYFIHSNAVEDYTASLKIGPMIPLGDEDVKIGVLGEANLEYFKRINKAYSIRADFFYTLYEQVVEDREVGQLEITRQELGVRYNYVFRF